MFTQAILETAKATIPRGHRRNYIPGWSTNLQHLHDSVCETREEMEQNPTHKLVTAHNKAKAEFTKTKLQSQRESWYEKTGSLNLEKDTSQLWQLTKTLNGDRIEKKQTAIENNGELLTGKKAANAMAKMYQEVSTVTLPRERTKAVRKELQQASGQEQNNDCMSTDLRMNELNEAIKKLKCKKAPGPDNITNDMILHFESKAKHTLLHMFNESWRKGESPINKEKGPHHPNSQKKEKKNKRWKVIDQSVC